MAQRPFILDSSKIPVTWDASVGDFIMRLLEFDPANRLGYNHIKDIKNHVWLRNLDWMGVKNKSYKSPLKIDKHKEYFRKNIMV